MQSKASAVWQGGLKDGSGQVSTASGVLANTPYNFTMRFEGAKGTTPEEMIAAAHAGCFAMAFSAQLGEAKITPKKIDAAATVTLEITPGGPAVTSSHLVFTVEAPGADRAAVEKAAENAKAGCPISKLLNTKITMEANYKL